MASRSLSNFHAALFHSDGKLSCIEISRWNMKDKNFTPLESMIALNITSGSYFLGFLVAFSDVINGYFFFISSDYTIISSLFAIAYLACFFLSENINDRIARLTFVTIMGLHFGLALNYVGMFSGVEIYIVCMLFMPLLIFSKTETKLLCSAYVLMSLVAGAATWFAVQSPPILNLSEEVKQLFYITNVLSVAAVVTFLIYSYSRSSIRHYIDLQVERSKSEQMLRDLLPKTVADKMIRGEQLVAQSHGECTVLFADLVGFTRLSERLSPIHLVELLNDIFSEIDVLSDKHGIEKIKTIGDCYMAAAGALESRGQPIEMVLLGLGIVDIVKRFAESTGYPLAVRVGINTGQVVSGMIGSRRRLFDVWGQTVNLAQMLESNSRINGVFVSETMQWRLRQRFRLSEVVYVSSKSGTVYSAYYVEDEVR